MREEKVNMKGGYSSLGDAIRRLREERRLSLRALAEQVGISAPFLSDIEHDRRRTDKLSEIAAALGVDALVLRELDGRVPQDLKDWLGDNPGLVTFLKDLKSSGQVVPLQELRKITRQAH